MKGNQIQKEFVGEIIRIEEADPADLVYERRRKREALKGKEIDKEKRIRTIDP